MLWTEQRPRLTFDLKLHITFPAPVCTPCSGCSPVLMRSTNSIPFSQRQSSLHERVSKYFEVLTYARVGQEPSPVFSSMMEELESFNCRISILLFWPTISEIIQDKTANNFLFHSNGPREKHSACMETLTVGTWINKTNWVREKEENNTWKGKWKKKKKPETFHYFVGIFFSPGQGTP